MRCLCAPYALQSTDIHSPRTQVGVEMGGTPLADFIHPPRAVYILGAEDMGIPSAVLKVSRTMCTLLTAVLIHCLLMYIERFDQCLPLL